MAGSVIIPLYVYPSMGAWDSVYDLYVQFDPPKRFSTREPDQDRASSYPQVEFTAIVNVNNGPGEGALPNSEYSYAIETLNSFNNVRTVGYVATTWCARNLSSVLDDVAAYSFWGEYQDSLAMDGIFVDETPTQYNPTSVSYLQTIAQAIHESDGLKDGYIGLVLAPDTPAIARAQGLPSHTVHNPGALPDAQFFVDSISEEDAHIAPDLTVVFENSFLNWTFQAPSLAEATKLYDPSRLALVLHSVPQLSVVDLETTLRQLLIVGHSVWLTGDSNYTKLDDHLSELIDGLAALL